MRKFKFRAWDIVEKIMFKPETENNNEMFFAGLVNGKLRVSESQYDDGDDFVLMQYTGLKDSKGNDIYEGDIVCYKQRNLDKALGYGQGDDYITKTKVIKYFDQSYNVPQGFIVELEVIGNIYENPELLSQ